MSMWSVCSADTGNRADRVPDHKRGSSHPGSPGWAQSGACLETTGTELRTSLVTALTLQRLPGHQRNVGGCVPAGCQLTNSQEGGLTKAVVGVAGLSTSWP